MVEAHPLYCVAESKLKVSLAGVKLEIEGSVIVELVQYLQVVFLFSVVCRGVVRRLREFCGGHQWAPGQSHAE